jgi:predicted DNA-binding transcriptional regulator YafY
MSPQGIEMGPLKGYATEKNFARPLLRCILDRGLSDGAFRLLCLLSAATWNESRIPLSFDEIADAAGVNVRTAQRQVAELVAAGFVRVKRRHNRRNEYSVVGGAVVKSEAVLAPVTQDDRECETCTRGLKVTKSGLCVACSREEKRVEQWRTAKAELPAGATPEEIAARVLANRTAQTYRTAAREAERIELREAEWSVA